VNFIIIASLTVICLWTINKLISILSLIKKMDMAKNWIEIDANVKYARVLDKDESNGVKLIKNKLAYFYAQYEFNGILYGTTKISFYAKESSSDRAIVRKLSKKDKTKIFINKDKPHQSVLINPSHHGYMFAWIKMVLGIMSMALIYLMVK
jgi:hypothetical protein